MARVMRDSGIEWIGEIPANWDLQKGKYLYCQRSEKGNSVELQLLSPTQKYGVIPQSLYEKISGMKPVQLDAKADLEQFKSIYSGDFCISLRSFQGGFEYSQYNGVVSPAYQVFYRQNDATSDAFYRYIFKEIGFIGYMNSFTKSFRDGKSIAFDDFAGTLLPVPPIAEQQSIADFLDRKCAEIDAVIEKTKATIEEYKKLKQSVITEAVTKGIRGNRPMKDSGIEWIGEIPTEWKLAKLKSITTEIGDGLHATPEYDAEGEYYFVNGNCIGGDRLVFKKNTDKLNENEYKKYKAPLINCNTIMIALNGTYGKTSFYHNEKVLLGKSAGYITLLPNINKRFVRYYLLSDSAYRIMELSLCGTTIPNLSLYTLRNFSTPIPSDEEMDEIVSYLDKQCKKLDNLIAKKTALLTELETYKKSLIYEYVTGKKEV